MPSDFAATVNEWASTYVKQLPKTRRAAKRSARQFQQKMLRMRSLMRLPQARVVSGTPEEDFARQVANERATPVV